MLNALELEIVSEPSRGPDGGKDMIVVETKSGPLAQRKTRWLVSCKHFYKSNRAVSEKDEINIIERMRIHGCHGFLGIYSTIPATTLSNQVEKINNETQEGQIIDPAKLERLLTSDKRLEDVFIRFFPKSFRKWKETSDRDQAVKLFSIFLKTHYGQFEKFFEEMFPDIKTLLKAITISSSFDELMRNQGIDVKVEPFLTKYSNISLDDLGVTPTTTVSEMYSQLIPARFESVPFAEFSNGKPSNIYSLCYFEPRWDDGTGGNELDQPASYFLYDKHLFVDPLYLKIFKTLFERLKTIIQ